MSIRRIIGVILIIVGVLGLIYQGIPYSEKEQVAELGPLEIEAEQEKSLPVHPIIGGILLAGGVILVITDRGKGGSESGG
ncbi:MAG TPA: DUF3185 domain-containing protein [Acidobacteriota bacterium]|nr:DUF3185 domain-containing protein [Acidobacteriota bacterium]